jgi:hypothetical protein
MSGFLLDTNCISELVRPKPEPRVVEWMEAADETMLYLSVLTVGGCIWRHSRRPGQIGVYVEVSYRNPRVRKTFGSPRTTMLAASDFRLIRNQAYLQVAYCVIRLSGEHARQISRVVHLHRSARHGDILSQSGFLIQQQNSR